jgi:hypothetical protein
MGKFTDKQKPSFISDLVEKKPTPTHEYTPTHTHTPVLREKKSHRLNVLMKPSTVDALKTYCKKYDVSMGDVINKLVEEFLDQNA